MIPEQLLLAELRKFNAKFDSLEKSLLTQSYDRGFIDGMIHLKHEIQNHRARPGDGLMRYKAALEQYMNDACVEEMGKRDLPDG